MRIFLIGALMLSLCGCTALANLAVSATTAGPTQAKSLAEAEQAAALAEKALDTYVTSGAATPAVKAELLILVPPLHNALKDAEAANKAGNSAAVALGMDAFNQALAALNAYETTHGVAH